MLTISFGSLVRSVAVRRGSFSSSFVVPAFRPGARAIVLRARGLLLRVPFRVLQGPTTAGPGGEAGTPAVAGPAVASHPGTQSAPVVVDFPFNLDFGGDQGGLTDRANIGTGFTYTPNTKGLGYVADNLAVEAGAGTLTIATTTGIAIRANNTLDNALAVGIRPSSSAFIVKTTLLKPPPGTRNYEQAGLWFGSDQDNYLKLVVISMRKGGTKIQALLEVNGISIASRLTAPLLLSESAVSLFVRADPATRQVSASYSVDGLPVAPLGTFGIPDRFFGLDPSAIDAALGTSSFAGIFATHRLGTGPLSFTFDDFSIVPA